MVQKKSGEVFVEYKNWYKCFKDELFRQPGVEEEKWGQPPFSINSAFIEGSAGRNFGRYTTSTQIG